MAALKQNPVAIYPAGLDFTALLVKLRTACHMSRNHLALLIGVNPSYLTRIENGERNPPKLDIVDALARGLGVYGTSTHDQLRVAAGYAPATLSAWTPSLSAVAKVVTSLDISQDSREEFETIVMGIAERWS
jgi:transcriptional regulator with XRE-family HTH domain